jgi:hypothetical protein
MVRKPLEAPAHECVELVERQVAMRWPRSFEQNFRVVKWIVDRG